MSKIFKMFLEPDDNVDLLMPRDSSILSIQMQGDKIAMWYYFDQSDMVVRRFQVYGTGHNVNASRSKYISTVQSGVFVWHIFESEI